MNQNLYKTHNLFFTINDKELLNELYRRADSSKILQYDINQRLKRYKVQVKIVNCHIYINFWNKQNQFGHVSLHIDHHNTTLSNKSQQRGRFHAKNNKGRTHTLKISQNRNYFSYNKTRVQNGGAFKYVLDIVISILNEYYDPNSPLSLTIRKNRQYNNKCTERSFDTSRDKL